MSNSTTQTPGTTNGSNSNRFKGTLIVMGCTVLGAIAQMLLKKGTALMPPLVDPALGNALAQAPLIAWKILNNLHLVGGLACYGMSTILLVLALRYGELSVLYPIIALTYVWVAALSVSLLGETLNAFKIVGLVLIVVGVAVLGLKEREA